MSNRLHIVLQATPRDSYEDDHSDYWNPFEWSPTSDRRPGSRAIYHIIVMCVKVLQAKGEERRRILNDFHFNHYGNNYSLKVYVGEHKNWESLASLGKRRQEQLVKQLLAKMHRLRDKGRRERKIPANT